MSAFGSGLDSLLIGRMRTAGGQDSVRVRQRVESALAHATPASLEARPGAILIVRRLAPAARLSVDSGERLDRFTGAVRAGLSELLDLARRPWLHADAASAEAVVFLDEEELIACLARDWVKGFISDRWWWRGVLGKLGAREWLRRHVLSRGEVLAAVVELLSAQRCAQDWIAALDTTEAVLGLSAISRAYRIADAGTIERDDEVSQSAGGGRRAADLAGLASSAAIPASIRTATEYAAFRELTELVPEVRSPRLAGEARRLLAVALAVRRNVVWAQGRALPLALSALESAPADAPRVHDVERSVAADSGMQPESTSGSSPAHVSSQPPLERAAFPSSVERSSGDGLAGAARSPRMSSSTSAIGGDPAPGDVTADVTPLAVAAVSDVDEQVVPAHDASTTEAQGHRLPDESPFPSAVESQFGGIFYLLNCALALGLYGDFTMPRAQGLDLSPWNWLALVGRAWFGRKFRRDSVWNVLAELAGRKPRQALWGRFVPPADWKIPEDWFEPWDRLSLPRPVFPTNSSRAARDRWLAGILVYLQARIALALGLDEVARVPRFVCRHPATVRRTSNSVDITFVLHELPLEIRTAGLDRDPGWIPAAGRSVSFHFK